MAINQTDRFKRIAHTYTFEVDGEADLPCGRTRKKLLRPAKVTVTVINGGTGVEVAVVGPRVLKAGLSDYETLRQVYGDYNTASAPQWVRDAISACVADAAADQ